MEIQAGSEEAVSKYGETFSTKEAFLKERRDLGQVSLKLVLHVLNPSASVIPFEHGGDKITFPDDFVLGNNYFFCLLWSF